MSAQDRPQPAAAVQPVRRLHPDLAGPTDLPSCPLPAGKLDPARRRRCGLHLNLVDHGFLRAVYLNLHAVDGDLWRAAQPAPAHLRRLKDRLGLRTVLNLRGRQGDNGTYRLEAEACEELGLRLIDFPLRSRSALDPATLIAAIDLFEHLEPPILMHCKSGADRTGLMATLWLFTHRGRPLKEALGQLHWRYGHVRRARTGILDFLFWRFAESGAQDFRSWVASDYDRDALNRDFRADPLAGLLVDHVLRRE